MPRISLLFAFTFAGALGCGPGANTPPPTDSCATPSSGSVDAVEIGAASSADLAGQHTTFTPLADGDGMSLIYGGQGATMLGFILRVTGASAPSCLGQQTIISDTGGARVTGSTAPLTTYAQPDGTRLTKPIWLPAEYPATFVVDTSAGGKSVTVHLHLLLAK
ncbi:MAG: hypothetical protein ACXVAN_11135 [Polyangia bacterium]